MTVSRAEGKDGGNSFYILHVMVDTAKEMRSWYESIKSLCVDLNQPIASENENVHASGSSNSPKSVGSGSVGSAQAPGQTTTTPSSKESKLDWKTDDKRPRDGNNYEQAFAFRKSGEALVMMLRNQSRTKTEFQESDFSSSFLALREDGSLVVFPQRPGFEVVESIALKGASIYRAGGGLGGIGQQRHGWRDGEVENMGCLLQVMQGDRKYMLWTATPDDVEDWYEALVLSSNSSLRSASPKQYSFQRHAASLLWKIRTDQS